MRNHHPNQSQNVYSNRITQCQHSQDLNLNLRHSFYHLVEEQRAQMRAAATEYQVTVVSTTMAGVNMTPLHVHVANDVWGSFDLRYRLCTSPSAAAIGPVPLSCAHKPVAAPLFGLSVSAAGVPFAGLFTAPTT